MKNLTYWAYSTAWFIVRMLPEKLAYSLAQIAADQIYTRNGKQIERLRSNYARVRPELSKGDLEALVRAGMHSYLRYWCDTFRLPSWSTKKIIADVVVENQHFLTDPIDEGRGCIVSLPHAGNWDHAGAYFCALGYKVVTVAEHLEPEKLFRKFLAYREAVGMEVLDASAAPFILRDIINKAGLDDVNIVRTKATGLKRYILDFLLSVSARNKDLT